MPKVLLVFADRESHQHFMTKRIMKRSGFQLEQFDVTYSYDPYLDQKLSKCAVAVAMGQVALTALIGESQPFRWMAKQIRHKSGCWVVGAMDPIRLLPNRASDEDDEESEEITRNPARFTGSVALALRKAIILNDNPEIYSVETNYTYDPSPEWFREYVDEILQVQPEFLSWDIETPYVRKDEDINLSEKPRIEEPNAVIRISFSWKIGEAVSIPWDHLYLPHIKRLFSGYKGYNVGWNSLDFDVPYLFRKGYQFLGPILDGMDAWHWLFSDLDRGLEHVTGYFTDILPWKHLSKSDPAHYSCIDADAALRNTIAIVKEIKSSGSWESYQSASLDLMMDHLYPAGRRGVRINPEKQLLLKTSLIEKLDTVLQEIQDLVPDKFKRFKQFARPKPQGTWTEISGAKEQRYCSKCEKINVSRSHPCIKSGEGEILRRVTEGKYYIQATPPEGQIREWVKQNGFNPNSTDQMRAYIRGNGHPLGSNHKNARPDEAVDAKHLKSLVGKFGAKFPVYQKTLETHKISKALSTYCYDADEYGLIHTTFTNKPSTWRLASQDVNLHNVGKREDNPYARMARATIEPLPGHVFLQGDSSAIEAVLVGYFMDDTSYMALARKSIHAYLVCKWHGWEWNDENLKKAKKDPLYDMMKRTVHGCLTGDHEVLTENGWVRFENYNFTTPVAVWDEKGSIQFESPIAKTEHYYEGDMYHYNGRAFETFCTPDHAFPINSVDTRTGKHWTAKRAAEEFPNFGRIPVTGSLKGANIIDKKLLQLLVAIQADATITSYGAIKWHLVKERKKLRLVELLDGYTYTRRDKDDDSFFTIQATDAKELIKYFDEYKIFKLPWLLGLSKELREAFLDELPYWDGTRGRAGSATTYQTTERKNAEIVQIIAHVTDRQALLREKTVRDAHHKPLWMVSFNARKEARIESMQKTVLSFSGKVYCITTSTGYFLTRYRDKVYVTSNTNYGMGYRLLYRQYPDFFPTSLAAKQCQDFLFKVLPQLEEWQHQIRIRAQKECYLESPWKHRHYFYDVFSYKVDNYGKLMYAPNGRPLVRLGKDAKRAVAYLPQHSGGMFMRENLGILGRSEWGKYMGANCNVHDSLCLMVPPKELEPAKRFLIDLLTRPIVKLGGLRIGCEIEVGENWLNMEKVATVTV